MTSRRPGSDSQVAPEVMAGNGYTAACDIWSLGVMMYIMLCGEAAAAPSVPCADLRAALRAVLRCIPLKFVLSF